MKISRLEIAKFARALSSLLRLGYNLEEAAEKALRSQGGSLQKNSEKLIDSLRRGETLSQAFQSYEKTFPLFFRIISSAERGEALPDGLIEASEVLEALVDRRNRNFLATLYPTLVVTFVVLGIVFLFRFCAGPFRELFYGMNLTLPLPTKIFISLNDALFTPFGSIFLFGPLTVLWLVVLGKTPIANLLYKVPILGRWLQQQEVSLYLKTVDQFLRLGTPLEEACSLSVSVCSKVVQKKFISIPDKLRSGDRLSQALEKTKFVPDLVIWTLEQREQTENLRLREIGTLLDREWDTTVKTGQILFEPFVYILVLVGLGGFAIAIFLPLYQLLGNLG